MRIVAKKSYKAKSTELVIRKGSKSQDDFFRTKSAYEFHIGKDWFRNIQLKYFQLLIRSIVQQAKQKHIEALVFDTGIFSSKNCSLPNTKLHTK